VAGTADQVERLTPVLVRFCTDIIPTGTFRSALAAKAANSLLTWACLVANHETLAPAKRWAVDVDALGAALLKTGAAKWGAAALGHQHDDPGGR